MAAEEVLRSTNAKANFQRLTRLLMCGGLRLLRETFDSIHSPADLPVKLSDPAVEAQLRGARLTRPEWDCLYPSPGVYGKSSDFDITLIFRLLRTICDLAPPPGPRGWDNLPNSSDHSLVADLVRIKYYRNGVYGHNNTMEISDLEFDDLWRKIREALIRIAANISPEKRDEWKKAIDDLLTNPLTPQEERYVQELDRWYKQDMAVKTEVEQLKEQVKTLQEEGRGSKESQGPAVLNITINIGNSLQLLYETERRIWEAILSAKKQTLNVLSYYFGYVRKVFVRSHDVGSLLITVECSSVQILEELWEDYRNGHLTEIAQEILVTAEVLEKLGLDEVKLETFISEEEYEKGKQILTESSEIPEETHLLDEEAADSSENPVEEVEDTVSLQTTKKDDNDAGFQKKPDSSPQAISEEGVLIGVRITLERLVELAQSDTGQSSKVSSKRRLEQEVGPQDMRIVPMPLEEKQNRIIWSAIISDPKPVESLLEYLRDKLRLIIGSYRIGSLLMKVECRSLQILQGLWEDYSSGHLNDVVQENLVTEEVLKELNLSEMKLKTSIKEEEYQSCEKYFLRKTAQKESTGVKGGVDTDEQAPHRLSEHSEEDKDKQRHTEGSKCE